MDYSKELPKTPTPAKSDLSIMKTFIDQKEMNKGHFKSKFTDILNPCRSVPDARRRNSFVLCRHLPFPQVSHLGLAHSTLRSNKHYFRLFQVLPSPRVCALRRRLKEVSLTRRPWPILSGAKVHSLPEFKKFC